MGQTLILARFTEKLEEKTLDHLNYYLNFAFQLMDRIDHTAVFLCQLAAVIPVRGRSQYAVLHKGLLRGSQPVQTKL